jgi:hypothetical protein
MRTLSQAKSNVCVQIKVLVDMCVCVCVTNVCSIMTGSAMRESVVKLRIETPGRGHTDPLVCALLAHAQGHLLDK